MAERIVSGRIPDDVKADIRERTDIVQLIGQYVELKRSGANHKGLCPFHDEKSPSFNVNPGRQFFHCFGCQESGDVFTFLMKIEGRTFPEVLEDLAQRAGIEIKREKFKGDSMRRSDRQESVDLNAEVARFYRRCLMDRIGDKAREYIVERGINDEISERFMLGFAPGSGDTIVRLAEKKGLSVPLAEKLGVIARRRSGDGYYDRFWNRLIFPLIVPGGDIVGFGGRLLSGDGPKYINTPETPLYQKGTTLYGLHAASKAIRQGDQAIVVEGNFDVIQLHQHGFTQAVAPMGTALTDQQVRLIRRFAGRAIVVFDGDEAGRKAARRAVETMITGGIDGKVAALPTGVDPDSILVEQGQEALRRILDRGVEGLDYLLADLQATQDNTVLGKVKVVDKIAPLIGSLEESVARDLYIDRLSMALEVDRGSIVRAVRGASQQRRPEPRSEPRPKREVTPLENDGLTALAILIEHPHLFPRAELGNIKSLLTNADLRATYSAAAEMQAATGQVETARLMEATSPQIKDAVAEAIMSGGFASAKDPTRALDECIMALQKRGLRIQLQEIRSQMSRARAEGDIEGLRELGKRLVEVERKIHETR